MAIESLNVTLGTTSPYDHVSAVVRGKTEPILGQDFSLDLDGITVNFEIESCSAKARGVNESIYSITGRERRGEILYRPVDATLPMIYNSETNAYGMPTVTQILHAAGLNVLYDAPDFRPTQAGMGWKTTNEAGTQNTTVRIRESSVQSLLEKLFGWSAEYGKRKICYHVRTGVIYVWELQRATGQSLTVTEQMCPEENAPVIDKQRIRKFTETTDTNGNEVSNPPGTWGGFGWDYADVPFSGGASHGTASLTYSNGVLVSSSKSETVNGVAVSTTENYSYNWSYGAPVLSSKTSTTDGVSTTTSYSYGMTREGATTGSGRNVPALASESTSNTKNSDQTIISYYPLGNGFMGTTATSIVNGKVDQVQHSVSKGSPGGAASQYTERQLKGWHITYTPNLPGYVLGSARLPIEDVELAELYLTEFKNLHGSVEQKLTAEVIGQLALNPINGKIVFRGVEYYAVHSAVANSSKGKRMNVSGIRWDYDEAYRRGVLGFTA